MIERGLDWWRVMENNSMKIRLTLGKISDEKGCFGRETDHL